MEIVISVMAVIVAAGCFIALLMSDLRESRVKDRGKNQG